MDVMPELSKETAALFHYLIPGFLAAWVFYGLTSHTKPSQFERVVQALIFTFLVQASLPPIRWSLVSLGNLHSFIPWSAATETVTSAIVAILLGVSLAYLTKKDSFHSWLRNKGFTDKTSHPSDWHYVFSALTKETEKDIKKEPEKEARYVVLHLSDERRISGYPRVWPSEPNKGHFFIETPAWLSDTGKQELVSGIQGMLINTQDVKWVEFLDQIKE